MEGLNNEGKEVKFDIKDHLLNLGEEKERKVMWSAGKDDTLGEDMYNHRMANGESWDEISDKSNKVINNLNKKIDDLKAIQDKLEDNVIEKDSIARGIDELRIECENALLKIKDADEKELEQHLLNEINKELDKIDEKREKLMESYFEIGEKIKEKSNIIDSQKVELN